MSHSNPTTPLEPEQRAAAPAHPPETTAPLEPAAVPACPPAGERYRLLGELARGGMGIVYRATDTILDREVAVKVLQESFAGHTSIARRFVDEARVTGQLQHPGIPAVHDLGTLADGRPFLAMKLVKGRTLADLLRDRPDPSAERGRWLAVFEQICQAVAYAHAHQVIHRDLKPANVMVGNFGEVQVMDWGLAKVLAPAAAGASPKPDEDGEPAGTEIRTLRELDGTETQAGSVLGTPAFMPPEQAGGETGKVDERADVFGLGALLSVLLTGQPPYVGLNVESVRLKAVRGQLGECLTRLDGCGAEPGLVDLCRRCLALDPADRPRSAAAVAQEVAALRAGAEERARQAELDRTRAEVEAREQRKRRRVQLALVAAVLVVIGISGGGWAWLRWQTQTRQAEADRGAALALTKAEQLAARAEQADNRTVAGAEAVVGLWHQAATAAEQAEGVAATAADQDLVDRVRQRGASLRDGLAQAEAELARARRAAVLLADLDRARARLAATVEGKADRVGAARAYQVAFQAGGLPAGAGPEELSAAIQVQRPAVREALIAALDQWADCLNQKPDQDRLRAAANQVDMEPRRRQIRAALTADDGTALLQLAEAGAVADLPAVTAALLGYALRNRRQPEAAERVLRAAWERHPSDFEVLRALGIVLADRSAGNPVKVEEEIGCIRAALAVRPESPLAHLDVGRALFKKKDWNGAEFCFRKAVQLDPGSGYAHSALGAALYEKQDVESAIACYRKGIQLDPTGAWAHNNLGNALYRKKDLEGASACYRKALQLDPGYATAHSSLGAVLSDKKDLKGAIACFRQALQLDPSKALAHNNLGTTLYDKKDLEGAIACYRQALQLDPNFVPAHNNLGAALLDRKDLEGAIACYRQALQLDPSFVPAHTGLGNALRDKKDLEGAIACYRQALKLDSSYALAHNCLGSALLDRKDVEGAIACFRQALQLDPSFAYAHNKLGHALRDKRDLEGAIACFRQALQLDPTYAPAHIDLGVALLDKKDVEGAIACFRQALQLDPSAAVAHYNLGAALRDKKDLEGAIACYRKAIQLNPSYVSAHNNLGAVLREKKDLEGAIACYRKAIQLDPTHARAHNNLGHALLDKKDQEGAIRCFRKVIQLDPTHAPAHNSLGWALQTQGDLAGAEACYRQALQLDPSFASAHNNLGWALQAKGDLAGAEACYRQATELDPKFALAQRNLDRCEKMLAVTSKVPAALTGADPSANNAERLVLAQVCANHGHNAAAARLFTTALAADPAAADDLLASHRYNAACYAALAGCGQGKDVGKLKDADRTDLRARALAWLRADLAAWKKRLAAGTPADRATVAEKMLHWLADTDLDGVRPGPKRIEQPAAEQTAWDAFWEEVRSTLAQAQKSPQPEP